MVKYRGFRNNLQQNRYDLIFDGKVFGALDRGGLTVNAERAKVLRNTGSANVNTSNLLEAIDEASENRSRVQIHSEKFEFNEPINIYAPIELCGMGAPSGKWNTLNPLGTKLIWSGDADYAIEWGATADSPQVLGAGKAVSGAVMRDLVILSSGGTSAILLDGSQTRYASRAGLTDVRMYNVSVQGTWSDHCLEIMGNVFDARFYDFGARGATDDLVQFTEAASQGSDRAGQLSFHSPVLLADEEGTNWAIDTNGPDGGYVTIFGGNIQGGKCLLAGYDTHVYGTHFECNDGPEVGKIGILLKGRGGNIQPAVLGGFGVGVQIGETDDNLQADGYNIVLTTLANNLIGVWNTGGTVGSRRNVVTVCREQLNTTLITDDTVGTALEGQLEVYSSLNLKQGPTSRRPDTGASPTLMRKGFQYFDTDLGKPVWWTGSGWVDATGADPDA